MSRVRIVIRYYDERNVVIFEDEANLRHWYRVPVQWSRWELYWDEVLVQAGRKEENHAQATAARAIAQREAAADSADAAQPQPGDDENEPGAGSNDGASLLWAVETGR